MADVTKAPRVGESAGAAYKLHIVQFMLHAKDRLERREFLEKLKPIAVRMKDRVRKIREKILLTLNANSPNAKKAVKMVFA